MALKVWYTSDDGTEAIERSTLTSMDADSQAGLHCWTFDWSDNRRGVTITWSDDIVIHYSIDNTEALENYRESYVVSATA